MISSGNAAAFAFIDMMVQGASSCSHSVSSLMYFVRVFPEASACDVIEERGHASIGRFDSAQGLAGQRASDRPAEALPEHELSEPSR